MNDDVRGQGKAGKLKDAIEAAWEDAKAKGAGPGTYEIKSIQIETNNPIHSYIVIIAPPDS
jgi:ribosomal protein S5